MRALYPSILSWILEGYQALLFFQTLLHSPYWLQPGLWIPQLLHQSWGLGQVRKPAVTTAGPFS